MKQPRPTVSRAARLAAGIAAVCLSAALGTRANALPPAGAAGAAAQAEPNNTGPLKVVTASWLGGEANDEIVSADVAADGSILLAGNSARLDFGKGLTTVLGPEGAPQTAAPPDDPKKAKGWRHPDTSGFIARLSPDGAKVLHLTRFGHGAATIEKMKTDAKGNVYVLGEAAAGAKGGGAGGDGAAAGRFVAALSADGMKVAWSVSHDGATDFGVDGNGDVVVLSKGHMTRYPAGGGAKKWDVTWASHGDNRPGGMAVSPKTGVAAVVGYGMTKTGHEPYKDPYAYGFDRDGKQVWALWNPDPTKEVDAKKYGGNGLMADTTGQAVGVGEGGDLYLMLFADGGNTVCSRDPYNVDEKLDPAVMDGVFQKGAGFGFKGASKTSVIFRADPASGKLEKGTWMSAWLTPSRANGLAIDAATGDDKGTQYVAGNSASGCPTKSPWYTAPEGGYLGGGFLAVFDKDFKMQQCGYFPGSTIKCVGQRGGTIVIAGSAVKENKAKDPNDAAAAEKTYAVPTYKPVQGAFGGGDKDGYFVVLKAEGK